MIKDPLLVSLLLFITVSFLKILNEKERTKRLFQFLPLPFWCYFLPTCFSTLGIIPYDLPLYSAMGRLMLPTALFLLLIGTDLHSIVHLKGQALWAMLYGTLGILIGGIVTYGIATQILPNTWDSELWKGWGALSATWTGGSANMLAIKEITDIPSSLFANLIVTDTFVAYFWMAILVYLTKYEKVIDTKLKADAIKIVIEPIDLKNPLPTPQSFVRRGIQILFLLILSTSFGLLFLIIPRWLPSWGSIFNPFLWTVLLATTVPLLLSQTSLKKVESLGASNLGQFLLYLMLASIGVRANIINLGTAPLFVLLGFLWVFIHGLVLLFFGRIFRIPVSLLATASQANIGGTISAPLVASLYSKNLTPIGVILATLGNIYGTYLGLTFSQVCRWFSDLIK